MEVAHPICCGIDVHQASLVACLRTVDDPGAVTQDTRTFQTTYRDLLALCDWLVAENCPIVAMESTGVYWRPVYHVLSGSLEVIVANAREVKPRRGKKTDKADASWIAELLAHDLISPSFVPPPEIRALRDLTRLRTSLVQTRTQSKNRVHKVLEDTNIKLASVASDLFGKSSRKMLDALIAGERDPKVLADMALGMLRKKIPQLELALDGAFTAHHAAMIRMLLELVDVLDRQIAELDGQIGILIEPLGRQIDRLTTIPGVKHTSARIVLSEIGCDMTRFASAGRLASWAGLCPGNNESAGKRKSGRTRKANKNLRRVLVECAWATGKTDTFLGRTFRRLQARIGGKKAAVAVGHKILVITYHLLNEDVDYDERRYGHPHPRQEARQRRNAIRALERMGYQVEIKKSA